MAVASVTARFSITIWRKPAGQMVIRNDTSNSHRIATSGGFPTYSSAL